MHIEEKFIKIGVQGFLFCTGAVLLFKLVSNFSLDLFLAIGIVAILLILTLRVEDLKSLYLGKDGVKAELEVLQKKTDKNQQELYDLISLSMGKETYTNLTKFDRPQGFGEYKIIIGEGLNSELYYLRNIGYVKLIEGTAPSIQDIPSEGDNLSKYIEITDKGKKYKELREKVSNVRGDRE